MKIQFTEAVVYETEGPRKGPSYSKDEVLECSEAFAQRWLRRGVAVEYVAPVVAQVAENKAADTPTRPDTTPGG